MVLPGSKQTLRDLKALQASGLAMELQRFSAEGGTVLGICGGLQMLGRACWIPMGSRDCWLSAAGLNLLPLQTRFGGSKALRQRTAGPMANRTACPIEGFELHRGSTTALEPLQALCQRRGWAGCRAGGGQLPAWPAGKRPLAAQWLNQLRRRKQLPNSPKTKASLTAAGGTARSARRCL